MLLAALCPMVSLPTWIAKMKCCKGIWSGSHWSNNSWTPHSYFYTDVFTARIRHILQLGKNGVVGEQYIQTWNENMNVTVCMVLGCAVSVCIWVSCLYRLPWNSLSQPVALQLLLKSSCHHLWALEKLAAALTSRRYQADKGCSRPQKHISTLPIIASDGEFAFPMIAHQHFSNNFQSRHNGCIAMSSL